MGKDRKQERQMPLLSWLRYDQGHDHQTDSGFGFPPMEHEPVARVLVGKLRFTPVGMFFFGFGLVAGIHLVALLSYWAFMRESLGDFVAWQLGEWPNVALFWFAYPLVVAFYPWVIWTSGSLYEKLRREGVLTDEVAGAKDSVSKTVNHPAWSLGALLIALATEAGIFLDGHFGAWRNIPGIGTDIWLFDAIGAIGNILGVYVIAIMVGRYIATLIGLSIVFRALEEKGKSDMLRPWHPDRCGGLGVLSDYAVRFAWFIAACGLTVVLFALLAAMAVSNADVSSSTESRALLTYLHLKPAIWVMIGLYVILSPALFFLTLGTAHRTMQNTKRKHLRLISDRLDHEYAEVRQKLNHKRASPTPSAQTIKDLNELYHLAETFPVWPFDLTTLRRFGTAVMAPFLTIGATVEIQQLLTRL